MRQILELSVLRRSTKMIDRQGSDSDGEEEGNVSFSLKWNFLILVF